MSSSTQRGVRGGIGAGARPGAGIGSIGCPIRRAKGSAEPRPSRRGSTMRYEPPRAAGSLTFGFYSGIVNRTPKGGGVRRQLDLGDRLAVLTAMAVDDHEGVPGSRATRAAPPPRLRHTDDVGALRPFNLRPIRMPGGG